MRFYFLILTFAFVSVCSAQDNRPKDDAVNKTQQSILKRLADVEKKDSVERASRAVDKAVADHIRILMAEDREHRDFIMTIYQYAIACAGIIVAILALVGWAGFSQWVKAIKNKLENELEVVEASSASSMRSRNF